MHNNQSKTHPHLRVIHFTEHLEKRQQERTNPFEALSAKLEKRIESIETQLKDSIRLLETDVQRLAKTKHASVSAQEFKKEFDDFSLALEHRIQKSVRELETQSSNKLKRDELGLLNKLTRQLTRVLSFDLYKNIAKPQAIELPKDTHQEVDEFGMDPHFIGQVKPFFDFLYHRYWRVVVTGINNIPNQGRALLVSNHSGTLPYDGAMIACSVFNEHAVRKDARFLVEDFVYHMPILGSFMYRIGGIRACPENAERLLGKEHLVIVFPEGVKGIGKYYRERYKLQRFGRGGFIKLCMNTKSPLIPVGIVGAEEIHPVIFKSNILAKSIGVPYIPITPTFPLLGLAGTLPLPTKWHIHFGEPISFGHHSKKETEDELLIHKLSEDVRGKIQSILVELLKKRQSVWY